MAIQFPARDRAEEIKKTTQKSLDKALLSLGQLKEFLVSTQRFEEAADLRQCEKAVEQSLTTLKSIYISSKVFSDDRTPSNGDRLYSNKEIQQKIARILPKLPTTELDKFCDKDYSKSVFDLNFPLVLKVPAHLSHIDKRDAVKDHSGLNRWTWKFEFQRDGFIYAITTQWYPWNDIYVEQWLRKQNNK